MNYWWEKAGMITYTQMLNHISNQRNANQNKNTITFYIHQTAKNQEEHHSKFTMEECERGRPSPAQLMALRNCAVVVGCTVTIKWKVVGLGSGSLELWVWWEILRQNERGLGDGSEDTALTIQVRGLEWDPPSLSWWLGRCDGTPVIQPEKVEKRSTRASWLGDYHDCWSSRTEWDSLPQNKVEEWTRRNSDINLGLPYARTHMYNHTHVNMNTNTHDTHGKEKKRKGGKWLKKAPNIHLCVSHAHTHTRAYMSMHTHINTKVKDGL